MATATVAIAGAALAAAGLAANTTNKPQGHDVKLVDAAQYVYDLGQSEISTGTALYNQGDFTSGLQSIIIGQNNVVVDSPQDALLEQIETPSQPYEFVVTEPGNIATPTNSAQFAEYLQLVSQIGQNLVTQGGNEIASGATNLGLADITRGTDDLAVILPEDALYGPTYINIATTGDPLGIPQNIYGLMDPASYGNDSLGFLANEINSEVVGPITSLAELSGVDIGPASGLLSAADAVDAVNEFSSHWGGYLDGNYLDATHVGLESSQLIFLAAGAMTQEALPEVSVPLDAIATALGGLDSAVTSLFG